MFPLFRLAYKKGKSYLSINSLEKFDWGKASLILELNFRKNWKGIHRVYISINKKKKAKELIKSISDIFESDYCFRKLKRNL